MANRQRSEREVIGYLAFMGILLAFGIDAALPAFDELRAAFDLPPESNRISLIVTLYFMGMAAGQLVYGPLADRYGRQPALIGGVALYCLGAIGSILAPSIELLFVSRLVWGLGAAAPGVLRTTIARDLYQGDQMARVIAIMMGVFMIGPILAPVIGDGILRIGSWHWVFAAALILAAVQLYWTSRFGETLDPENRRPLELGKVAEGFRSVFGTATTMRYTLALTFSFGAFVVFLGSSQPIIAELYDRGEQFAFLFAVSSIALVVSFLSVNRFIVRWGAHRVAVGSALIALGASTSLLFAALTQDGLPNFWIWFVLVAVANAFLTLLTPTCYSLALAPMGDRAGTASGVMGFMAAAGGSLLAAIVDAAIDDTITPMAIGYVGYGAVGVLMLLWAGVGAEPTPTLPVQAIQPPGGA